METLLTILTNNENPSTHPALHGQATCAIDSVMVPMAVSPMLSLICMCGVRMWTETYATLGTPRLSCQWIQGKKELLAIGAWLSATLRGLEPHKTTRQMNGTQQAYGHRLRATGQG